MKLMVYTAMAVSLLGLEACTYTTPVSVAPNLNVYSSYGTKIPGKFLLYVEADNLTTTAVANGQGCSFHKYPLDVAPSFRESVTGTMRQLVDEVETIDHPITTAEIAAQGAKGLIIVKGNELTARFSVIPGFWTATAEESVDMSASLTVDGVTGRLLGTEAEGSGRSTVQGGGSCGTITNGLAEATEKAMKKVLGELGERFSNSPRVRGQPASSSGS